MAEKIADVYYEVGYKIDDKEIKKVDTTTENIGKQFKKTGKEAEDLGKKIEKAGKGAGKGKQEFEGLGEEVDNAGKKIKKTKGNFQEFNSFMEDFASGLSIGAGVAAIGELVKVSVNDYIKYDDSLRKTGAKISATNEQMIKLSESTRDVAREYNANPLTVSDAQEFLALAGYNFEQIQQASPLIIQAQKATGESMQLVSDIATDTASAYGYTADELDYVTDRMVYTTNKFNTNFAQMGEAMKYVAPIGKQAGLEFSDLSSYIGVLANNGIKGSQAGTALRQTFLRLQSPTGIATKLLNKYNVELFDQQGNFIGVNNSMLKIEKATKKMTEQQKAFFLQQMFGTEAMSSINILFKEGIDNIIEYGDNIELADGKTKEMADFMEQGLGGSIRKLENRFADLKLEIGETFELPAKYGFELGSEGLDNIQTEISKNRDIGYKITGAMDAYKNLVAGGFNLAKKGVDLFFDYAGFGILRPVKKGIGNYLEERGRKVETDLEFKSEDLITPEQKLNYKLGTYFSNYEMDKKNLEFLTGENQNIKSPYGFNINLNINPMLNNVHMNNELINILSNPSTQEELESIFNEFLERKYQASFVGFGGNRW